MTLNPLPVGFLDHTVLVHATIPSISDNLLLNVGQGNPCFRLESHKHGYFMPSHREFSDEKGANGVVIIVGVGYST